MRTVRSAGVLLVRDSYWPEVLLLRHASRLDLPKGHVEAGESDLEAALRELQEETGVPAHAVEVVLGARHEITY
jgi:bis(5'-nucleosidyl)-tetraphosphatase